MKTLRQINIKIRQNYFFNSITNIKNFDQNLLNIDQISFKSSDCVTYDVSKILIIQILSILFLKM